MRFFLNETRNKIIIVIFVLIIYSQTTFFNFAMDDTMLVENNNYVKKGITGWTELISDNYFNSDNNYLKNGKPLNEAGEYFIGANRPITVLTHCLDVSLYSMNPKFHHATNVFLYIILLLLIYRFLSTIFKMSVVDAFFLTVLFLVHPVHVESVANIKGRDDILFAIFGMASFIWSFKNSRFSKGISLLFCIFSLLSKETGLIFIFMIPLAHLYKDSSEIRLKKLYEYLPFFLIGFVYLFFRIFYDKGTTEIALNVYNNAINTVVGKSNQLIFTLQIFFHYFDLTIWPNPLLWDYSVGHFKYTQDSIKVAAMTIFVILFFSVLFIKSKGPENFKLRMGILFYFAPLLVTGNIFIMIPSTFGERFLFLPILGYLLILSHFSRRIFSKSQGTHIFVIGCIICLFAIMSFNRVAMWKDSKTLCLEDVKHGGSVRTLWSNVTFAAEKKNYDSAVVFLNLLLDADTSYRKCVIGNKEKLYVYRGKYYELLGLRDLAIADFKLAIELNDTMFEANTELARSLMRKSSSNANVAINFMNKGLLSYFKSMRGRQLDSSYAKNLQDLSVMYFCKGDLDRVLPCMLQSIQYGNRNHNIILDASRLLFNKGDHIQCHKVLSLVINNINNGSEIKSLYRENLVFISGYPTIK